MRRVLLALLLLWLSTVRAQFQDPVHFTVKQNRLSDAELEVVFVGTMEPGWHVYGTDIKDGGPTRATLTLEKQKGVKPKGGLRATGKVERETDELFGMEVSFMEGTASFAQKFMLTGGDYEVGGYLTYGACNDQNCLPPTDVEFSFKGNLSPALPQGEGKAIAPETSDSPDNSENPETTDTLEDTIGGQAPEPTVTTQEGGAAGSLPLREGRGEAVGEGSWLRIFLLGLLGGLAALLTPCVWPIIPMTVSFFLKRGNGVRDAVTYGLSIIVIYMALGLLVTLLFGASALNAMSTNAVFNIFFFLLLLLFAASFLGGFEITLPSSWGNAVDSKAAKTTGLLSIFLMAFTLALVSFSCTGPIIGFLLVEVASTGNIAGPAVGMFGFALALALPFTLFALFPSWLKRAPKSGNWMNCIKVTLGFLELAFSLKFLSVADLAYGWHLLDREVFLSLWIVIFALLGTYLIGWLRFPHDEEEYDEAGEVVIHQRTSVTRFFLALISFAFALYMLPGLWGAPCKAVSAFAPPMSTQDFVMNSEKGQVRSEKRQVIGPLSTSQEADVSSSHFSPLTSHPSKFEDYEEGMAYAKAHGKPVLLDFTGYGCVNCRKMEAAVWTNPEVKQIMDNDYVVISLWVDDKTPLPTVQVVEENGKQVKLRSVGDKWSHLQRHKFGANAQPFYVLVTPDGKPLSAPYGYNEDVAAYVRWLQGGLKNYFNP